MESFWIPIFVLSIIFCSVFGFATFIIFLLWIFLKFRGGLQKSCPGCGSLMPSRSRFCTHCGKELPRAEKNGSSHIFLTLFAVSLAITVLSIGGIVFSAISSGLGVSEFTEYSLNLNNHATSSSWSINFDEVRGGRLKKNIAIENGRPSQLHIQSHLNSGDMTVELSQDNITKTIDLSSSNKDASIDLTGFKYGRVTIKVIINHAYGGGINMWWD